MHYPSIGAVLPAVGYGGQQFADLAATIRAADCDAVVVGTPVDLGRLVDVAHPIRSATYELREIESPTSVEVLAPRVELWRLAQR